MKRTTYVAIAILILLLTLVLAGCSTLSVQAPPNMFVSTGDYVPGIRTMGIIQEKSTVWAPLFFVDVNKVHEQLYKALISKAQDAGANGVTDIKFSWKPSPLSYVTIWILTPVLDFYVEGVAIKK